MALQLFLTHVSLTIRRTCSTRHAVFKKMGFRKLLENLNYHRFFQTVLGKSVQRPAKLDRRLARELKSLTDPEDPYDTIIGKTMCTYDFYEGT